MTIYSLPTMAHTEKLPDGCVVALGFFDGVHLGHRRIIDAARQEAERRGTDVGVWMISASGVCYKASAPMLTDETEKFSLLHSAGARFACVQDFSEVKGLSGEYFAENILKSILKVSCVVCGFNFRFGNGASCGVAELAELGEKYGFDTVVLGPVTDEGDETVSSTRIRSLISAGDVENAALLLGRPYSFTAPVLKGKELGRRLGFPTANQVIPAGRLTPENGVYAVEAVFSINGRRVSRPGAANIGYCPTITEEELCLAEVSPYSLENDGAARAGRRVAETYIIDFDGDLYGRDVKISFLRRLRGEVKFDSVEKLKAQIESDARHAETIFNEIYGTVK